MDYHHLSNITKKLPKKKNKQTNKQIEGFPKGTKSEPGETMNTSNNIRHKPSTTLCVCSSSHLMWNTHYNWYYLVAPPLPPLIGISIDHE